jgi:sortase A
MSRLKHILSLGSLILGIGCMVWAIVEIKTQSVYSSAVETSPSLSIASTQEKNRQPEIGPFTANAKPFAYVGLKEEEILYPVRPTEGDNIGSLTIPAIKQVLPIIHGANEDELKKGVGHFAQSVLPGEKDNSVLSGHRDTVFRQLGKLKIHDSLIVKTSAGEFTYIIQTIKIVHKDDKSVIAPADHAVLTVTTCYPFDYIGDAPDRYILTADLMERVVQ